MTKTRMEILRELTAAFSEVDFIAFRDALAEASSLDELGPGAGPLGPLLAKVIDRDVHIHLHELHAADMVGHEFDGWDGFLRFWRSWMEPWDSYDVRFTRWEEIGETVMYRLEIEARGRGSGVEVKDALTQAWTIPEDKVTRLGMYARRRSALADLKRE